MRTLPVVFLLALAGGLYYLSQVDRKGPTALTVVELEGQLGVPLFLPILGLAVVFGVMAWMGGRPPRSRTREPVAPGGSPRPRPVRRGPAALPGDWQGTVDRSVDEAVFEDGVQLVKTGRPQCPYVLKLTRLPPERARRAIGDYAQLLAGMPTPPRAQVQYIGMSDEGAPRHHLVAGAFGRFFERADFRCIRSGDDVDVLFAQPDSRWLG